MGCAGGGVGVGGIGVGVAGGGVGVSVTITVIVISAGDITLWFCAWLVMTVPAIAKPMDSARIKQSSPILNR